MTQKKTPAAGFDDWVDMWEKAQGDGTFDNAPKPPPLRGGSGSFFGVHSQSPDFDTPPSDADTEYWNQVYQRSNNAGDAPDVAYPEMLQEQKKPVEKKPQKVENQKKKKRKPLSEGKVATPAELRGVAQAQLRSPNPIYHYNVGKDQDPYVTQNWGVGGKEITELADLKVKLHALEGKLNTMIGSGKPDRQVQKLESELRKLRNRLDELSDSLQSGWAGEYKD